MNDWIVLREVYFRNVIRECITLLVKLHPPFIGLIHSPMWETPGLPYVGNPRAMVRSSVRVAAAPPPRALGLRLKASGTRRLRG